MAELKSYQVKSRIRFSGKVYRPGGDPIVLTDADAARFAKLGCIEPVPVPELALEPMPVTEPVPELAPEPMPVAEPVPGGDTVSTDAPEADPGAAATGKKEAAKASKGS